MKCNRVFLKPLSFKLHLIVVGVEVEGAYVLISPGGLQIEGNTLNPSSEFDSSPTAYDTLYVLITLAVLAIINNFLHILFVQIKEQMFNFTIDIYSYVCF